MKDFYFLFIKGLKEIYDAEKQIVKALPEMIKASHDPELKEILQSHLTETKGQVKRLQEIATDLNEDLEGPENAIIKAHIKEGQKLIKTKLDPIVKDAAIITAAQLIEHYEISM